jgi:DtxR family Mn-dependent transcriptional regulator
MSRRGYHGLVATETAENYLKAIFALAAESATAEAAMSRIAAVVGVTTGTATSMIQKLARARLVRYERFGGVSLTAAGRRAALDILRRHRLVEVFLVRTLGMDWSQVHAEAERLEHAISPRVLDALDRHLGHPAFDPHGDPIPGADGRMREPALVPWSTCRKGDRGTVARVLDQREPTLRFLRRHGLDIGTSLRVHAVEPGAGTIVVRASRGVTVPLSETAAASVLMRRVTLPRRSSRA